MTRVNTAEAKKKLGRILQHTALTKRRIVVTSRGKDLAAVVSLEDVKLLEDIEDRLDLDHARKALGHAGREGTVAWEKIKRDLGL